MASSVKLGSHNDYISQSQGCVVTMKGFKKQAPAVDSQVRIVSKKETAVSTDPVKVSLHDCLACSGCITTAETVMLEQQSTGELLSQLSASNKAVVVSLSPQSRASLAAYYGLTPLQAFKKLSGFLKSLGVKAVFDTSCSRDISLVESCAEFVERFREKKKFPILASSCPGWVCYAEKTHGDDVLPYISAVKSPQQVMGTILKRYVCKSLGLLPEDVYHVTIMPCYDKKLEAAREDFIFEVEGEGLTEGNKPQITEVDCVLTSGEILDLLQTRNVVFGELEEVPLDRVLTNVDEREHLYGVSGGSGGYAECIFRYASRELFGKEISGPLQFKTLRNADFREITLEVDGKQVLKFALVYGFRNIQNIVRQIKAGRCDYHFMEVMACPSGCLNGGGQIKPKKGQTAKELIQQLEGAYLNDVDVREPFENEIVKGLYKEWLGYPSSEKASQIMRTQYHVREKTVANFVSDW
ncbi:protein NAR1 [Physcomitrium patens]|uniref:Iron hydrogenase small subunit domain-containing protein n=1 Tax=Physcomitrium patens TaxID=3218 RepID=A0A2K1KFW6_PHYPA|nr:protein NAR1-like [Physcomitrium patens]PNR52671.1 hypothetical protein PHYPA_009045 [Physcomitrium patens]|eukprot:XP_024378244.1 protein NAR1-like [Physcomitrella patens]